MDLELNEERKMLKSMARDFLTTECTKKLVREMEQDERGYPPELWKKMGKLGWMGLALPEEFGGTGGGLLDLAVLLEEMGRALLPGPFFSAVILGGMTILSLGNEAQKAALLPGVARGDRIVTLALTEPVARHDIDRITTEAIASRDSFTINGTKLFVPDAHVADHFICVARAAEGVSLFLVDGKSPGVRCTQLKTMAGDKQCQVEFNNVLVSRESILGELGRGRDGLEPILRKALVAKCAEMVGGAQQVFEMTLDYAKTRMQFGRAIGSFQVIQHYLANMLTDLEASRFITYETAHNMDQGLPCTKEASVAKAWVSEASRRISAAAHQIHGAIGYSAEHDLYLYSRKAKTNEVFLGSADIHRETIAREIGL